MKYLIAVLIITLMNIGLMFVDKDPEEMPEVIYKVEPVIYLKSVEEFQAAIDVQGVVVIEIWADWNSDNAYPISELRGADVYRADIEELTYLWKNYKIESLPTLLFFLDGDYLFKDESDVSFERTHDIDFVQGVIDCLNDGEDNCDE